MARLPAVRTSYSNDHAHLARLVQAIEMDITATKEWRTEIITLLHKAQMLMIEENTRRYAEGRV